MLIIIWVWAWPTLWLQFEAGATLLDGSARGFGAGAGNAQLEVVVAVLDKMGYSTGIDLYGVLDAADVAEKTLVSKYAQY